MLAAFVTAGMMIGCDSSATKVSDAEQAVVDAQIALEQARKDSIADYEKTNAEWAVLIAKNEVAISEYKVKLEKMEKKQRAKDEEKLAEMEQRNADMKERMSAFNPDGTINWMVFKADLKASIEEFDRDMNELGKSIAKIAEPAKK